MNVADKAVVITGAGSGVGRSTAQLLGANGAKLILAGRTAEKLEVVADEVRSQGGEALPVPTDIRSREQCEALIARTVEQYGRIDILVNNAGLGIYGPIETVKGEDLEVLFDTNLKGAIYCAQAAYERMKDQRSGHIINIASVAGKYGLPGESAYVSTKFALVGFAGSLKKEAIHHGVRVDTLCPGGIDTPFWDLVPNPPDTANFLSPDDVAGMVLYVAGTPTHMVFEDIVVHPHEEYVKRFA
ncbi:MAG: SDR family oxidoreductase [Candidatus Bipolaricaulia bacterium]